MNKRNAIALMAMSVLGVPAAKAEDNWPSRTVKVVLGVAPGGATDIQARIFTQKLTRDLGQPFIVENRPGGGEIVAIQSVIRAAPDGYTVVAVTPTLTITPAFYENEKPPFDPTKDLMPVSIVTRAPYLVVVPAASPFKTMKDMVAFIKSARGALNFGTAGLNSAPQLGAVWVGASAGSPVTIINYKGTGPALTALLASEVHAIFANPISSLSLVKSGKLRALAVTSAERSKVFPDLPTLAESGLPGLDVTTWHGWLVPKGTPPAIVAKMQAALSTMVHSPDVAEGLAADGGEPVGSTPEQFSQVIATELVRWRKVVKDANLKPE